MDCKSCEENLSALLDGELGPSEADRIRSHIKNCPSCSEELRSLQETADLVEAHSREIELRPGAWNLVQARINTEDRPVPAFAWLTNRWRIAVATLAVFGVLGFGYVQYQQLQRRSLDGYISRYVQERENWIRPHRPYPVSAAAGTAVNRPQNPYPDNPFVEVKAAAGNPFLSEER